MSYHALGGLGVLPAVTGVATNTQSTAVRTLQAQLRVLGFLPASGIDGYFGPNTMNALGAAARSLGYTGETVTSTLSGSTPRFTVPAALLAAIDGAATAAAAAAPTVDPTVGPGDAAVLQQAADDEAAASPAGTPDYKMYIAVGVGILALISGAVYLSKKPAASTPAAVKANRRRMRRNGVFDELRQQTWEEEKTKRDRAARAAAEERASEEHARGVSSSAFSEFRKQHGLKANSASRRARVRRSRRRAA